MPNTASGTWRCDHCGAEKTLSPYKNEYALSDNRALQFCSWLCHISFIGDCSETTIHDLRPSARQVWRDTISGKMVRVLESPGNGLVRAAWKDTGDPQSFPLADFVSDFKIVHGR